MRRQTKAIHREGSLARDWRGHWRTAMVALDLWVWGIALVAQATGMSFTFESHNR